jgi:hypothetical protein
MCNLRAIIAPPLTCSAPHPRCGPEVCARLRNVAWRAHSCHHQRAVMGTRLGVSMFQDTGSRPAFALD